MNQWIKISDLGRPLRHGDILKYNTWNINFEIRVSFVLPEGGVMDAHGHTWAVVSPNEWLVLVKSYPKPFWIGEVEHIPTHRRYGFTVPGTDIEEAKRVIMSEYGKEYKIAWLNRKDGK